MLYTYFNLEELRLLAFDLAIAYDDIPGATKRDKAREVVLYFRRHGRLDELLDYIQKTRPKTALPRSEARLTRTQLANWRSKPEAHSLFFLDVDAAIVRANDWGAWLDTMLSDIGIAGVVAPTFAPDHAWSHLFLTNFVDIIFADNRDVGTSLREARHQFYAESSGNPLGLIYAHFGDPTMVLTGSNIRSSVEEERI